MKDTPRLIKTSAVNKVRAAVNKGLLPRLSEVEVSCKDCGKRAKHYDHRDYGNPLDVDPVCISCNLKRGPGISTKRENNKRFDLFCNKCGHKWMGHIINPIKCPRCQTFKWKVKK